MIDRESADARYGAFILEITAMEVVKTGGKGLSISTEVTVIIEVGAKFTITQIDKCSYLLFITLRTMSKVSP